MKVSRQLEKDRKQWMTTPTSTSSLEHGGRCQDDGGEMGTSQREGDMGDGRQDGAREKGEGKGKGKGKGSAIPRSAALLSCPACMTTLCMDCQQ